MAIHLSFSILFLFSSLSCSLSSQAAADNQVHAKVRVEDLMLQEGDIIFQRTPGFSGQVFEEVSGSRWTHVGVIQKIGAHWYVNEAYQFVTRTELSAFIDRGIDGDYIIARVKPEFLDLSQTSNQEKLDDSLRSFFGRPYDDYFEWSDDRMYCSELVWKVFQSAFGKPVSALKKLRDFRLDGPLATQLIKEYEQNTGSQINYDETVVAPSTILESAALKRIYNSY